MNTPPATCPLCGNTALQEGYHGPMRPAGIDSNPVEGHRILRCEDCDLEILHPLPTSLREYYSSDQYWTEHKKHAARKDAQRKLDPEQGIWLRHMGLERFRGARLVDFGAGAGLFLDACKGFAASTTAVEPSTLFSADLQQSGHIHSTDANQLPAGCADIVVSLDTLEHLESPVQALQSMKRLLAPGGTLWIGVPNQADFLKQISPDYLTFFYHLSHLHYHSARSLACAIEAAGMKVISMRSVHKYDFSNLICWLREGRPQKGSHWPVLDAHSEDSYIRNLERQGIGSHLLAEATHKDQP